MSKRKTGDLQKHTLNLRQGDMQRLAALFPRHSPSVMIRRLVSQYIDRVEAASNAPPPNLREPIDIDLD